MTATCTNCSTVFRGLDRDEDGHGFIDTTRCALPGCEVYLCGATCQEFSFACACGSRFCNEHATEIPDGTPRPLKLCPTCALECEIDLAPRRPLVTARPAVAGAVA